MPSDNSITIRLPYTGSTRNFMRFIGGPSDYSKVYLPMTDVPPGKVVTSVNVVVILRDAEPTPVRHAASLGNCMCGQPDCDRTCDR